MTQRHTFLCSLFLGMLIAAGAGYAAPAVSTAATNFEELLRKANARDIPSMLAIARAYESGSGVKFDFEESYRWYYKVALTGHAESQHKVGRRLVDRLLFISDKNKRQASATEGIGWLRKAANQGYADAYAPLGDFYSNGKHVQQDLVAAYKWYHLAVLKSTGIFTRSGAERERNEISKKLTESQRIRAKNDADIHLNLMMPR